VVAGADDLAALEAADVKRDGQLVLRPVLVEDTFSQEEVESETKGAWYVRQLVGAANIDGSPLFHVASGNLSYQVEHHLYPDMPSTRYNEIAPKVRDVCKRYGLPYNTGPFSQQWGMVQRTILRLAFPGGNPRPKPGPYHGDEVVEAPGMNGSGANGSPSASSNGSSRRPAATENVPAEGPSESGAAGPAEG